MAQTPEKYKLLVVDDSTAIIHKITAAIPKDKYDVATTTNPVTAYKMIEDHHFDIVISDIEMPEMNGLELLKKIKLFNGMTQVIVITGFITVNNTLNAFRYGAFDLIFKPFNTKLIVSAVDQSAKRLQHINELLIHAQQRKGNTNGS